MIKHATYRRVVLALAGMAAFCAHAQTGVGNQEVIVVKEYEVKIQDAQKINLNPTVPEFSDKIPVLSYSVPAKDFKDISFETNPLKPLSISKEKVEKFNTSFVKIGFGSQLTPLVQLAYNDNKTKNLQFGVFYNHLSGYGFKIKNQRYSDDEAGVYLRYQPKAVEIGTNFTFRNNRVHFYGYNHSDTSFTEKAVRQVYRNYDANLYIKNSKKNKAEVNIKQSFQFNYLQETFGKSSEWFVGGKTLLDKSFIKYHRVVIGFNFDISLLKRDSFKLQRNIFELQPGYEFDNDDWEARGYAGFAIDGKNVFPIADVHVEKRFYQHILIGYSSYNLRYLKNSLRSLSTDNNFIQDSVPMLNSRSGDFSAGVKGTAENFSYNVAFHFQHIRNMPLFINDTNDTKRFIVLYDKKVQIFGLHAEGGYNVKEWLRLVAIADYNVFLMDSQTHAWHTPNLKFTLRGNYSFKNKILVNLDLFGLTPTYAKLTDGKVVKLKGTADINIGIEYVFKKYLSFFGNLNNIAHIKYQRCYNYPGYGINGLVGLKFSF